MKTVAEIGVVGRMKVEPDIDYFKDLAANTFPEVLGSGMTHGLTHPERLSVLRWIAGKHTGVPEFP